MSSARGYHRAMATLSREDVEHVAHLARLGLSDEELARLEGQLNHILDQYAVLASSRPTTSRRRPRPSSSRTSCATTRRVRRSRSTRCCATRPTTTARSSWSRRSSEASDRYLTRLRAHDMADRLRSGEVSSRELTEAHLDLADRQNDALHAWLSIDRERALAEAAPPTSGSGQRAMAAPGPWVGCTPCSASRSRSRTWSRSPVVSAPPVRGSSMAIARRTTRTSPSACATSGR